MRGIHQWLVDSPHKGPVTWKSFPAMTSSCCVEGYLRACDNLINWWQSSQYDSLSVHHVIMLHPLSPVAPFTNMLLVLSLPFIFITIYGVVCVQLAHFSLGDWKDIFIAHVIIIIKSEVSTLPIVIIFFRGCVPEMFVTSYSVAYGIYIPGKLGFCFHYYCAVYDEFK